MPPQLPERATPGSLLMERRDVPTPAAMALARVSYGLAQRLRTLWFSGHYALTARMSPRAHGGPPPEMLPSWQTVNDDLGDLFRRDWRNIEAGLYRLPHDLWPNPVTMLGRSAHYFRDLEAVNRRKQARRADEVSGPETIGRYPRYYLQNFHYQSGGYLSRDSAALYDYQVEVLFTGGADAMRRQLLVPLRAAFAASSVCASTRTRMNGLAASRPCATISSVGAWPPSSLMMFHDFSGASASIIAIATSSPTTRPATTMSNVARSRSE